MGEGRKLFYCKVICGREEVLTESEPPSDANPHYWQHGGHFVGQGYHSVHGLGHGYDGIAETIVFRYGQAQPLLVVTLKI